MRKSLVIAARDYKAAVKTKTFLISLLAMPLVMGLSVLLQWVFRDTVDTSDKRFALVNRTARADLDQLVEKHVAQYNQHQVFDPETKKQVKPRFVLDVMTGTGSTAAAIEQQRLELSDQVRQAKLVGFVELVEPGRNGANAAKEKGTESGSRLVLRYQSNSLTYHDFSRLVERTLSEALRQEEAARAGLSAAQTRAILQPVALVSKGLSSRDERTGKISEASDLSRAGAIAVPMVLMMIMFMVLMMNTTPMTQAVVEEKMQRIAEVLLGSVRPFELMLGKLLGMTGVALTIAAVYLIGAIWAADRFGFMELVTAELVAWFVVYLALASLMFGSLFIAVGAACSDLRETQNLIWPLVILICLPLFLLGNILQEPNGPVARNMSFFPFATPLMMVVRQAIPPGIPRWEPIVGVLLVVATTLLCVYAAGRIFRVGILMQGKGARLTEIFKWVVRG